MTLVYAGQHATRLNAFGSGGSASRVIILWSESPAGYAVRQLRRRSAQRAQIVRMDIVRSFVVDSATAFELVARLQLGENEREMMMGKGLLLWLIGIPLPVILVLWLIFR